MKTLGKFLIFFLTLPLLHAAGVTAKVDRSNITLGERVVLNLHVEGENIEEPTIGKICNTDVLSTSRSTNMQIINGSYSKAQVLSYSFMPSESCTIDPIAVKIDGKYYSTDKVEITVGAMTIDKNAPFILEMEAEKPSVHVGEPFKVTITLKQRHNAEAVDSKFLQPQMKNFWVKEQQQSKRFEQGDYSVTKVVYIMAAQKAGMQHIGHAQLQVAQRSHSRDAWGQWFPQLQWRSYFSNELDLEVKDLPQGVNLVGDFKISLDVENTEIDAGEALNATLKISGSGNFEDITSLKPHIENVSIYEEDPATKSYLENGAYKGTWSQKMALVADSDYTIPAISLSYYDPKEARVKTVKTTPVAISVKGTRVKKEESVTVERAQTEPMKAVQAPQIQSESAVIPWWAAGVLGLLAGLALGVIPWQRLFNRESKKRTRVSVGNEKAALNVLVQHLDDSEAAAMADLLERRLYEGDQTPVDKVTLKQLLKRYM